VTKREMSDKKYGILDGILDGIFTSKLFTKFNAKVVFFLSNTKHSIRFSISLF